MSKELLLLITAISLVVLVKLVELYKRYRPHITTVLLPDNHRRVLFCWYSYYDWYDLYGRHIWSRRIIRKKLFTL